MTKLEAFELRGKWDNDGLAWLDNKRTPEFDLVNEWDCQECCEHHNPASPCP